MCTLYTIKTPLAKIASRLCADIAGGLAESCPDRMLPKSMGPVFYSNGDRIVVEPMQFSLLPAWAKERTLKFATHNARLDSVDSKPAWRDPFLRNHCLVPMDEFIEGIYTGEYAGNMVAFRREDEEALLAAGIYDLWRDKLSGECILSYAIITIDADPFIAGAGHDRQPLFLADETALAWLQSKTQSTPELKQLLSQGRMRPVFSARVDRPLKAGWEKRISKRAGMRP